MLIGLTGKKQAGKDTAYERTLLRYAGAIVVERASFADRLYQSAAASLGVDPADLHEWKNNPAFRVQVVFRHLYSDQSIRQYLQSYGTEAHRDLFGPHFWTDQVDLTHGWGSILMVTDVRFDSEAEVVRRHGGFVVRVMGPTEVENVADGHASEAGLPDRLVDDVLVNCVRDDDFASLDCQLDHLFRRLWKRTTEPAPVPA